MFRTRRIVVALATVALVTTGTGATATPANESPARNRPVPEAIKVPPGNKKIATMSARGVQTYQCAAGAWTFLQPDAILDDRGRSRVLHSRGPVWTSVEDGSSVTAAAVANSPVDGAIPQLLLQATANRAPGVFGTVTYIQRLNTRGGLSPTGACTDGTTTSVRYTADYTFWVAG